jgi:hypothetical protein
VSDDEKNNKLNLPPARLELQQTRLRVEEGELVRRNVSGGIVTRVPLDDIEGVRYTRDLSLFAVVTWLFSAGLAAIGFFVSENNVVSVALYVLASLGAAFGLIGLLNDVLLVKTRGENIRIACSDPGDEVAGFAMSLKAMTGGGQE